LSLAKSHVSLTVISQAAIIFAIEHQDMSKAFTKETDGDDDEEVDDVIVRNLLRDGSSKGWSDRRTRLC